MSYADWLQRIQPPWLHGERGQAWARALGSALDRAVDGAVEAVQVRHPSYAPEDVLALIGEDRGIPRLPSDEPLELWRARVRGAWDWWRWGGTRRGLELALARVGLPAEVVEGPFENYFDGSWHFGDYDGAFTGHAWAEFILRLNLPPERGFTTRDRTYLRHVVREVKPAHAALRRVELYAGDRRRLRVSPSPFAQVLDYGTFGDFLFGETRIQLLHGGISLGAWAEGRLLRAQVFGGWDFDGTTGF